ncbi:MAG: hypothetical protein NC418_00070 [Muribaculaceae bacterium]|nr:hypothetical protein [Muribaculaceae bacterium]
MKKSILAGIFALSFASLMQAQTSQLSIIPVDAAGDTYHDGNDYPDKIDMALNADGTFSAKGVSIEYGFYFLGNNATDGTLYSLAPWAVTPAVQIGPNPLNIASESMKNYIVTSDETYDITFIPKGVDGVSSNMFTIVPAGMTHGEYPAQIYLATGYGASKCVAVPGADGVYTMDVKEPVSGFKISYEPTNEEAAFVYGPTGDAGAVALAKDTKVGIARGEGFASTFSAEPVEGGTTRLTVSLVEGDQYVEITSQMVTALESLDVEAEQATAFYTLSGVKVDRTADTLPAGVYVAVSPSGARKIAVR